MINSMTDLSSVAAYLRRIGAEPRSLRIAIVQEAHGNYWQDIATIRINKDGTVDAPEEYAPTDSEAIVIKSEVVAAKWPTSQKLGKSYMLPPELEGIKDEDLFEIKDRDGNLIMLHQRIVNRSDGNKRYAPWSFWSDNRWRRAEPEGPLPLFGLETIGNNTIIFIHEGAKAARFVQRLINPRTDEERKAFADHPWANELSAGAHIGWIGGALNPGRTDWSELMKCGIERAFIVADNDYAGKSAIPKISQKLRNMIVFSIEFTEMWPYKFDLADKFPDRMFKKFNGARNYVGPPMRATMHPATWATDLIPTPKGKPVPVIRKEFTQLWAWIEETETYICKEMPNIHRSLRQFNSMMRAFSHRNVEVGKLINEAYKGRSTKLTYRPDISERTVTDGKTSAVNLHEPTTVKTSEGSPRPWLEFLEYLFPREREREEVARWCATLVARPDVRMMYGMLLISERQGMGKTTLGERILAPLVGLDNAGFPGERDIVESSFNGWVANKRLVIVNEIYTGHSFKAYNMLKGYITDKSVNVNEKFMRPYVVENWVHVLACSNSKKALRIEETDRRWFYPTLNEVPWQKGKWGEFFDWLKSGGLGTILRWAQEYDNYVESGAHAPDTDAKAALIQESRGEALNLCSDFFDAHNGEIVAYADIELREAIKKKVGNGRMFETPADIRKTAKRSGWFEHSERIKVDGMMVTAILSPALREKIQRGELVSGISDMNDLTPDEKQKLHIAIRSYLKRAREVMEEEF